MENYWKGKRILITGGSGFIGSSINARIKRIAMSFSPDQLQESVVSTSVMTPNADSVNLVNNSDVTRLLESSDPDIIIHAAGVKGTRQNRDKPAELFYDNLMMGTQLMHEAWKFNPKIKFVNLGTARSYAPSTDSSVRERDFWKGYPELSNAPYAMAKSILLVQSQTYRQQYGFNSIYLILANVYGPGDNFSDSSPVIPSFIKKILNHKTGILDFSGNPATKREFIYIDDAVDGILSAVEKYDSDEPLNIGTGRQTSMMKLERIIKSYLNREYPYTWGTGNEPPTAPLDISNAEFFLNFRSKVGLEDGIKKTIDWYLENK